MRKVVPIVDVYSCYSVLLSFGKTCEDMMSPLSDKAIMVGYNYLNNV